MSTALAADSAEAHAKRWRDWQLKNEHSQRKGARRARLVFTTIFIVLGLWLAAQFVSTQVG